MASYLSLRTLISKVSALLAIASLSVIPAKAGGVKITDYGHSSLLIKGGGQSILLNPFRAVGCAAGLKEPRVRANVILASSELADEGAKIAKGKFFVKPGSYRVGKLKLEGIAAPKDRFGGRRYGSSTLWQWEQSGLKFVHLGGAVSPLTEVDKILFGKPDVLIIAVGGGPKAFNGIEAAKVVDQLRPKRVIPVHYLKGPTIQNCDLKGIQPFLNAIKDAEVNKVGSTFYIKSRLSDKTIINIMR